MNSLSNELSKGERGGWGREDEGGEKKKGEGGWGRGGEKRGKTVLRLSPRALSPRYTCFIKNFAKI